MAILGFHSLGSAIHRLVLIGMVGTLWGPAAPRRQTEEPGLRISGDIPAAVRLKQVDLDQLPQEDASVSEEDGTTTKYTGVLLRDVLSKVGAPSGRALRGKSMATYVLAKARDDYEVMFTLAELDPAFGNERVLLIDKREGKPLFGYQGPFRILCPNDKAGARSLRMLSSLEIVKLRK